MVFNSQINNTFSTVQPENSFYSARNNYNYELDDNLQELDVHKLKYTPLKAEVVSYIDDHGELEGGRSRTGRFFKKLGKSIKKGAHKLDRDTRGMQNQVRQGAYKLDRSTRAEQNKIKEAAFATDRATRPIRKEVREIGFELDRGTRPAQKKFAKFGNDVKRSAIDKNGLVHNLIESTADVVIPMASTAIGTAVGTAAGNPAMGAMAGKAIGQIGRKTLKKQTGYGKKPDEELKLNDIINKYVPNFTKDVKEVKTKVKKLPTARNILVKKIMNENPHFTLPQASKYIKENNLY